jgi:hypothetical protein
MPKTLLTDEHCSKLRTILREHRIYDSPILLVADDKKTTEYLDSAAFLLIALCSWSH